MTKGRVGLLTNTNCDGLQIDYHFDSGLNICVFRLKEAINNGSYADV